MGRWFRNHDAELCGVALWFATLFFMWWYDSEKFWIELVYATNGGVSGSLLAVWWIKYFKERVASED